MTETNSDTCYLLIGGADGMLNVSVRADAGKIAALRIDAPSGFGGMIWKMVAQMLADSPLERDALNERIARLNKSGLIPDELNLEPLVNTILRLGKT